MTLTETQKEQFSLLQLTNTAPQSIFGSLLLAVIYRTRRGLALLIGILPLLVWGACQGYIAFVYRNTTYFVSLLGHTYAYKYGAASPGIVLEIFWFLSVTISVLGVITSALVTCIGVAFRSKIALTYSVVIFLLTLVLVLAIVLIIAPEGFLLIDTHAQSNLIIGQVLYAAVLVAGLPSIAAFGSFKYFTRY